MHCRAKSTTTVPIQQYEVLFFVKHQVGGNYVIWIQKHLRYTSSNSHLSQKTRVRLDELSSAI